MTASRGRFGQARRRPSRRSPRWTPAAAWCGRRPRGQRERQLVEDGRRPWAARSTTTTSVGRARDRRTRRPSTVAERRVGRDRRSRPGGAGGSYSAYIVAAELAVSRCSPISRTPPLRLARASAAWCQSVLDLGASRRRRRRCVGPLVDRVAEPVEVRPPERLVLAPVVAERRGQHRDRGLLGGAVARRRRRRAAASVRRELVGDLRRRTPSRDRLRRHVAARRPRWREPAASRAAAGWRGSRSGCSPRSPRARSRPRRRAPVVAQLAVAGVLDDRVGRGGHLAGAQLVAHVERLELLDAVAVPTRMLCAPTGTGRRARRRAAGRRPRPRRRRSGRPAAAAPSSRRPRSGRCAVRVALRRLRTIARKSTQRLPLLGPVVRPERAGTRRSASSTPEQVLQPPLAAVGRPQRVALEVEEQVALVGLGQHLSGCASTTSNGGLPSIARRDLQPGLRGQRVDRARGQLGHRAVVRGQVRARGDARRRSAGRAGWPACRRPAAGRRARGPGSRTPGSGSRRARSSSSHDTGGAAGEVVVEQPLQRRAPGPVDREQVVDAVAADGAVAEHQLDVGAPPGRPRAASVSA